MIFSILVIYIILLYLLDKIIFRKQDKRKNTYLKLLFVPMILLLGFRSIQTGIDTEQYYRKFELLSQSGLTDIFGEDIEFGYRVFQIAFHKLGLNFQALLFGVAFFYLSTVYKLIKSYSSNLFISTLLFIGFGFYSFAFSGIRQTIALTFVILAFLQLTNKKELIALVLILIGSTFHISALVFIPVVFVRFLNFSSIWMFSIFVLFLILSYLLVDYVRLIMIDFARIDYGVVTTGGLKLYFINWSMLLIPLLNWKKYKNNYENIVLYTIIFFGVLIFPIIRINPVTLRISYYFQIFMIVYLPISFSTIKNKVISRGLGLLYVLIGIYWLFSDLLIKAELFDYMFFWNR